MSLNVLSRLKIAHVFQRVPRLSHWLSIHFTFGAVTIFGIVIPSAPGYALHDACIQAAALWLPSEEGRDRTVIKWGKPIRFSVISGDGELSAGKSLETEKSLEEEMAFIADKSRLNVISKTKSNEDIRNIDFLIVVVPDLVRFAPKLRELAEVFFQTKPQAAAGRIRIDPVAWEQKNREMAPKCSGLNLYSGGEITSAFSLIQDGETASCFSVGLGELFGLSNIRKYYADSGQKISTEKSASALQSLYSDAIRPGMSEAAAREKLEEICR
jgi:hypothetical protein